MIVSEDPLSACSVDGRPWAQPDGVRALFRGAPATAVYLIVLTATTVALALERHREAHRTALRASTNLHNLLTQPVRVLVVSALLLVPGWLIWPLGALVVGVMAAAERRLGTVRTLVVFAVGHVGASVVTVFGIAVGVAVGWMPSSLTHAVDVGPSYGLAALAGVLVAGVTDRTLRVVSIVALVTVLAVAAVLGGDFTDAGHLVAALIGLALARAAAGARPGRGLLGTA